MSSVPALVQQSEDAALPSLAPLTQKESMLLCREVRSDLAKASRYTAEARRKIKVFRDRSGWKPLGYKTFVEGATTEFGCSVAHLYRMMTCADVEANIAVADCNVGDVPEMITRPLVGLPAPVQRAAFQEAVKEANGKMPTTTQVKNAVGKMYPQDDPKSSPRGEDSSEDNACIECRESSPRGEDLSEPADVRKARKLGIIPENGKVTVEGENEPATEPGPDDLPIEQTDEEYLAEFPVRDKLSDIVRRRFDAEAIAFRKLTPLRTKFAYNSREILEEGKRKAGHHVGPWMHLFYRFAQAKDPSHWLHCKSCKGTGVDGMVGKCADCHGEGYHVR